MLVELLGRKGTWRLLGRVELGHGGDVVEAAMGSDVGVVQSEGLLHPEQRNRPTRENQKEKRARA